ncbi:MAG: radical SAM protein [Parcubacteria group bacterium]
MRILLVAYDNQSFIHWFPQGLAYVAAVLREAGHEIKIYQQDQFHYPDEHLTEYLNNNKFDIIGVSIIAGYYQFRKLLSISNAINLSDQRPFYIIGGHGPAPEPEYFIKKTKADAVVIGEGENTIVELVDAIENHKSLRNVRGIAFQDNGNIVINERRPLIQDIDSLPFPAYDLFPIEYYRLLRMPHVANTDFVMPMLSGRGCCFKCAFCYRMDEGFRPRSNESIIAEIKLLKKNFGITYIAFGDELLMSSAQRTISLCNDFIKAGLDIKWDCNGRLNYAEPGVLQLMKRAGCVFINYGIEAMDDQVLRGMNKALTTAQIIKGIEATLAVGISPGFNIIFGNVGDNQETLNKGVEFLLKYDDCGQFRTIRPVTPYPGSALYYLAIKNGLIKDCEDFYENKHINSDLLSVNFTTMSDEDFHRALFEANKRLFDNYYRKKNQAAIDTAEKLYIGKDGTFRGFRQS